MAHLALSLLGCFQAIRDGRPIAAFESNKERALLAYLAIEAAHPQPRSVLAGLLWPDTPDTMALANLRFALSNLRQAIGDPGASTPILLVTRDAVQFNPAGDYSLDLDEIDTLSYIDAKPAASVVTLCRRGFLAGLSLAGCVAYEEWIADQQARIDQRLRVVLKQRADRHEHNGDYTSAEQWARLRLEDDPWDEDAHQQVMRALACTGQRSAALAHYETCRRLLARELGVVPSLQTDDLQRAISDGALVPVQAAVVANSIPTPVSTFVGRRHELTAVARLVQQGARLVTLTGAGGCGKTRLAIELSRQFARARFFADGVRWVDLAGIVDAALVPAAVAGACGLEQALPDSQLDILFERLADREMLLVLDNCEHLVDASAQLVQALLLACAGLRIMTTGRQTLDVTGETVWRVPALSSPDKNKTDVLSPAQLLEYDAVRLFCERARSIVSNWSFEDNAVDVAEVCSRLDGIPLAIELAAARLNVLSVRDIADRLDDQLHLLTGGSRGAIARHRTLRATLDWSYQLLSGTERVLFRRLAVFSGGCTLDAVSAICRDDSQPELIDVLGALVEKSLLIAEQQGTHMRYHMLETVRRYGTEIAEGGEFSANRTRHLGYYTALAETARPKLDSTEEAAWLQTLQREHANLRAAWQWAIDTDLDSAVAIYAALVHFWRDYGYLSEARLWGQQLLPKLEQWGNDRRRAHALNAVGTMAVIQVDYALARPIFESALAMARAVGAPEEEAVALCNLGSTYHVLGDYNAARSHLDAAVALTRQVGDTVHEALALQYLNYWSVRHGDTAAARMFMHAALARFRTVGGRYFISRALHALAGVAAAEGHQDEAAGLIEESMRIARELPRAVWHIPLRSLGMLALRRGEHARARAHLNEALELESEQGRPQSIIACLHCHVALALDLGQDERAACLLGASDARCEEAAWTMSPGVTSTVQQYTERATAALGQEQYRRAWAAGYAMTRQQSVAYALSAPTEPKLPIPAAKAHQAS